LKKHTGVPNQERIEMRLFALLVAIGSLSQPAVAQTSNCKPIADPTARLACYDRAASAEQPVLVKPAALSPAKLGTSKVDTEKYVDSIGAEEALVNTRLKNICRGC
jgi:hypothetical protein